MRIPTQAKNLVAKHFAKEYAGVTPDIEQNVRNALSSEKVEERAARLERFGCGKLLEIGSGPGLLGVVWTGEYTGIEPDKTILAAGNLIAKSNHAKARYVLGVGENLPFPDNTFDLVASFQVLEHVRDTQQVLKEAVRVLKPGGMLVFEMPNYRFPWEGHYGMFWLPCFPKPLARVYLRLRNRQTAFLDSLQYTTPGMLRKLIRRLPVEAVSFGENLWSERLRQGPVFYGHTAKLKPFYSVTRKLGLISIIDWLGRKLGLYYPIQLVLRKK